MLKTGFSFSPSIIMMLESEAIVNGAQCRTRSDSFYSPFPRYFILVGSNPVSIRTDTFHQFKQKLNNSPFYLFNK